MNITEDKAKGLVIIGAGLLVAYAVYRAYRAASGATAQVQASVSEAIDAVSESWQSAGAAVTKAKNSALNVVGALPSNDGYPEARPIRAPLSDDAVNRINAEASKNQATHLLQDDPMYNTSGGGMFQMSFAEDASFYNGKMVALPVDPFNFDRSNTAIA